MALIQVGPIVSDIRGSINGVTFGRNRAGIFARQRVVPVDPASPIQGVRRSQLAFLSGQWATVLSVAQRQGWNDLGTATIFQNSLGEDFNPSGFQLFMRVNMLKSVMGQPFKGTAPTQAVIGIGPLTLQHTTGVGIEVVAVDNPPTSDGDTMFQRSTNLSLGINFFKTPFQSLVVKPFEDFAALPVLIYPNSELVGLQAYFIRTRAMQDNGKSTNGVIHRLRTSDPL